MYGFSSFRPWDPLLDLHQYENDFCIQTKTSHQGPALIGAYEGKSIDVNVESGRSVKSAGRHGSKKRRNVPVDSDTSSGGSVTHQEGKLDCEQLSGRFGVNSVSYRKAFFEAKIRRRPLCQSSLFLNGCAMRSLSLSAGIPRNGAKADMLAQGAFCLERNFPCAATRGKPVFKCIRRSEAMRIASAKFCGVLETHFCERRP